MQKKTSSLLLFIVLVVFANAQSLENYSLKNVGKIEHLKSSEIKQSPWGIQFNTFPFHSNTQYEDLDVKQFLTDAPKLIEMASELGLKWARVSVDWPSVEDKNGNFHFELLDATLQPLKDNGITIYLCFNNGHPVYTGKKQSPVVSEKALEAWLNWVELTVKRYKDIVDYWEVWNEPNYLHYAKKELDPEDYSKLLKASAKVIKEHDQGSKILCGGMARFDVPYHERLFELGVQDYVDVIQVHPYGEIPEACLLNIRRTVETPTWYQPASNKASELIKLVENSGKDIEIWQGECGYASAYNSRGWTGNGPFSENIQAKWILRRGLTDLTFGAKVSTYFLFREQTGINNTSSVNYKGLVPFDTFNPKKGYQSYQNLCSTFTGRFEKVEGINSKCNLISKGSFPGIKEKDIFTTVLKNDEGKTFFCYWLPTRMLDETKPAKINITIDSLNFKNPVLLNLMDGMIYKPEKVERQSEWLTFRGLPISDFPFIITEK